MNHLHPTLSISNRLMMICLIASLVCLLLVTLRAERIGIDKETLKKELTDYAIDKIFSGLPNMPEDKLKEATYFNELVREMAPLGVKLDETNFTEKALEIYNKYKEAIDKGKTPQEARDNVKNLMKGDVGAIITMSLDESSQEVIKELQGLYDDAQKELKAITDLNQALEEDPEADYAELMKKFGVKGEYLEKFEKMEGQMRKAYEEYGDYYEAGKIIYKGMSGTSGDKIESLFELGATFGGKIPVLGKFVELYFEVAQEMLKATGRLGKLLQERQQGCLGVGTSGWIETIKSYMNDRNVSFSKQFPNVTVCPVNEAMEFYRDIYDQVGSVNQLYFWTGSGFVVGNPKHGGIDDVKAFRSWLRSNNHVDKVSDMKFMAKSYNIPSGFLEKKKQLEEMVEDINSNVKRLRDALGYCLGNREFSDLLRDKGGLQRVIDTSDGKAENDSYLRNVGLYSPNVVDKIIDDRYIKKKIIFHKACKDAQAKLREIVVVRITGVVRVDKGAAPQPTSNVTIKVDSKDRIIEKCSTLLTRSNGSFEILTVKDKSDSYSLNLQADDGTNTSDEVTVSIAGSQEKYSVNLTVEGECKEDERLDEDGNCVPMCEEGEELNENGKCVPICGDNEELDEANICVCNDGYEKFNNDCVAECKPNEKREDNGDCVAVCEENEKLDEEGNCVPACKPYEKLDKEGNCLAVCKETEKIDDKGNCIAVCKPNEKIDEKGNCIVVCRPNEKLDDKGNCIAVCKPNEKVDDKGNCIAVC